MDEPDADLLRAWHVRGDRVALETLVGRHLAQVHRLMHRMTMNPTTADDLTQEVFLRVARSLDTFAANSSFSTWLHRIALNVAYSHGDAARRRPLEPLDANSTPVAPARHGPLEQVLSVERIAIIEHALAELPPKRRAALVLVCLEHMSVEEVAAIEGCPPQTIYSRLHEARRQLKSQLKEFLP